MTNEQLPVLFQDHVDLARCVNERQVLVLGSGTHLDHRIMRDCMIDDRFPPVFITRDDFAFPGGFREPVEIDSMVREMYEETRYGLSSWKRAEAKKPEGSSLLTKLLRRL